MEKTETAGNTELSDAYAEYSPQNWTFSKVDVEPTHLEAYEI